MTTKAFTATGAGVQVRPVSAPHVQNDKPRNLLEHAARQDSLQTARQVIAGALSLARASAHYDDLPLADVNLSDHNRWARLPVDARLREIASWLVAECYEVMDLIESPPISTKGD